MHESEQDSELHVISDGSLFKRCVIKIILSLSGLITYTSLSLEVVREGESFICSLVYVADTCVSSCVTVEI